MDQLPRHRARESALVDTLWTTSPGDAARREAWRDHAEWLQQMDDPVGQWLAARVHGDAETTPHEPTDPEIRARLLGPELAAVLDDPLRAPLLELTWEHGFIVRAAMYIHQRMMRFHGWDAGDRSRYGQPLDVVLTALLRSPAARLLHRLGIDALDFLGLHERASDVDAVFEQLDEPPPLRSLSLGSVWSSVPGSRTIFARLPGLERLCLRVREYERDIETMFDEPDPFEEMVGWLAAELPRLRDLEISMHFAGDQIVQALVVHAPALAGRLRRLRVDYVQRRGAALLELVARSLPALERCVLGGYSGSPVAREVLREAGFEFAEFEPVPTLGSF